VIKTFADRHAEELLARGQSKRLPPEIVRRARRKLEHLDLAASLDDLRSREIDFTSSGETAKVNMRSPSMTNGAFASASLRVMLTRLKLRIITEVRW